MTLEFYDKQGESTQDVHAATMAAVYDRVGNRDEHIYYFMAQDQLDAAVHKWLDTGEAVGATMRFQNLSAKTAQGMQDKLSALTAQTDLEHFIETGCKAYVLSEAWEARKVCESPESL